MNQNKTKTIVIIGGLSAGPAAAARARRDCEDCRILLFEKGAQISYATCGLPYAVSGEIQNRKNLIIVEPKLMQNRFNVEMHLDEEILSVDTQAKTVSSAKGVYSYDKLIVATGAKAVLPPVSGVSEIKAKSTLRTLEDFDYIMHNETFQKAQHVTVVGGGLIGVELAENLAMMNKKTVIVEAAPHILPMFSSDFAFMAKTILVNNQVEVIENELMTAVKNVDDQIEVTLKSGKTFKTDFIFFSAGISPNSSLLPDAQKLPNGAIVVDEKMQTSISDVYAAGDCAAIKNSLTGKHDYLPLGTHSNKGGRVAGANAVGQNLTYQGGYGTAIVKIFDHTFARTGLNSRQIGEYQGKVKKALINASASASYYPGNESMLLQILYDEQSGRVLGAEAAGKKGVDKRIDVLATAIYAKLNVEDLSEIDLAYAPPYSPAKDPVVVIGHVAGNHRRHACSPLAIQDAKQYIAETKNLTIIDVRTTGEIQQYGQFEGSKNINIDELRKQISQLDKSKPYLLVCQKGIRGYIGALILRHNGFENVKNLAGGYSAYLALHRR